MPERTGSQSEAYQAKFAALLNITRVMNSAHDVESLLQIIMKEGAQAVEADRGSIWLHDVDSDQLWASVFLGIDKSDPDIRIPSGEGIAGHVFQTGNVLNIADAYEDDRFNASVDLRVGYKTENVLGVPMTLAGGGILGVLQLVNKRSGRFTAEDEELLTVLADQAAIAISNAREFANVREEATRASKETQVLRDQLTGEFVGVSPRILEIRDLSERISSSPVTVLITGESGTGKTHIARLIHFKSNRASKPFIYLNCAAIPESLVESELFGIEGGVATGVQKKIGRIEQADGGTLFLDEIADMSPQIQAKVLQVLQDREFQRVGGMEPIHVDVRFIAATNKDLDEEVEGGRFREDLYYRLNVLAFIMPPLRERREDIAPLVQHLLKKTCHEYNKQIPVLGVEALDALQRYPWPGNIRELENEIRRLSSLVQDGETVESDQLSKRILNVELGIDDSFATFAGMSSLPEAVEALEKTMIHDALRNSKFNKAATARELGISREGLRKKLKRYDIDVDALKQTPA